MMPDLRLGFHIDEDSNCGSVLGHDSVGIVVIGQ
jgi:hypothetical protein